MERQRLVVFVCLLMLPVLIQVNAETSGNIESGTSAVNMSPNNPVVGGDATFTVLLYNPSSTDAFDVEYTFYKDARGGPLLIGDKIDILAGETEQVSVTWTSLPEGQQDIWFEFKDGSTSAYFSYEFTVAGLPTIRILELMTNETETIRSGDDVEVAMRVKNTGSVDAPESTLLLQFPGQDDDYLQTPALTAGEEVWLTTSAPAPSSGTYTITATPDINNDIQEGSETNKAKTVEMNVEPHMDLYFKEGITIDVVGDSFAGPWAVSGTLVRVNGSGTTEVSLQLEIPNPSGGLIRTDHFQVVVSGNEVAEQSFSWEFQLDSLPAGQHEVTAIINSIGDASIIQERTDNDIAITSLSISAIPNVIFIENAVANRSTVTASEDVTWQITIINSGDMPVSGTLHYTFDGISESTIVNLEAEETKDVILPNLQTGLGQHTAYFNASWERASGSYDANPSDSFSVGSVFVESPLKMKWDYASLAIVDEEGNNATTPLRHGKLYTLSLDLTATSSIGQFNISCIDDGGETQNIIPVNIEQERQRENVECSFIAYASITNVKMVPDDSSIVDSLSRSFQTINPTNQGQENGDSSSSGTATILGLGALVLIGVLVAAYILTRPSEEEVERDIFDYCPACDGELDGEVDRCPHCSFNLKKARNQFHDCHECGESIPDLLENCAYCGAVQDVASFFEQRERKVAPQIKQFVSLPEEEEEDEDQIVTGQEGFADAIKEFGFDEEHLEDEWDKNIEAAEAEVEAAYDRRNADIIAEDEMTEEELEEYKSQVTTTIRKSTSTTHDIDSILKGKKSLTSVKDDDSELSASDAHIREQLFEITGEEGVMPGEKVNIGMQLSDSSLAGNEVQEASLDFTIEEDDVPLAKSAIDEINDELNPKRKSKRRRPHKKKVETADCGACGAEIPVDAKECSVCGAKFE